MSITGQVINSYDDEEGEAKHEDPANNQDPQEEAGDDMNVEEPNHGFDPGLMVGID